MSNATVEIKVFPDKEMLALDMAEVLRSLAFYSGIMQGCTIVIPSGTTKLTISSGRMFIRGRVAEVTGGDLPTPTNLATTQTCYVEAVCDLSADPPFYIKVCTAQEKADLQALVQQQDLDAVDYNANNGLTFIELGTVSVEAGTGAALQYSPNSTFGVVHNNSETLARSIATINNSISSNVTTLNSTINSKESALSTRINNTNTALNNHNNANQAMFEYIQPRLFNKNGHGFAQQVIVYPTVDVPANGTVQVEFEYGYNVTHNVTINGSAMSRSVSGLTGNPYLPTASFSPGTNSYGYPTSLDPRLYAIAINSVRFADAAKGGGKNANNCVIAGFAYDAGSPYKCYIKVRNVGTSAARIDIRVKFLYATHE